MCKNKESKLDEFSKFQLTVKQLASLKGGSDTSSDDKTYIIIVEEIFD